MDRGRWLRRVRAAGLASAVVLAAACAAPRPSGTLADLWRWNASATFDEQGTTISADYEAWPMDTEPLAYACTRQPANVFDGPVFLPGAEPDCAPFTATIEGTRLHIAIDRAGLPPAFDGVDWWSIVLAMQTEEGRWSQIGGMPSKLPWLQVVGTPSP